MPLTDVVARKAAPAERPIRLWDAGGLYLEVRPSGSKLWMLKYRIAGREKRIGLGAYPLISLRQAREKRDEARRLLLAGLDPSAERQRAREAQRRAAGATVRAVSEEWIADRAQQWTDAYAADCRRAFELHIYPRLGERPIAEVQPHELLDALRVLTGDGTHRETARRLRQKLEAIWNFALLAGRATSNAAAPLKGVLVPPVVRNFPAVAERDLPALLLALDAYGNVLVQAAVWLQLLTVTRPGETRSARWVEFDLDGATWTIPAERMKRRREHVVPLSRQALAWLERLRPVSGHLPVLFPSRSRPSVPMSGNTVNKVMDLCGVPAEDRRRGTRGPFADATAHGFRSLFSTVAHEAGKRSDVVEACLAHIDTNRTRASYNRATHLQARRDLLQWWADRIEAGLAGEGGRVLAFSGDHA
jgi:integrase